MFARTERLLLRPGWLEDAPALARAIGEEAVVRNLARAPWPYGMDEAQDFLGRPVDPAQPSFLIFAHRRRPAPRRRLRHRAEPRRAARNGLLIARPYWGLGFATEAGRQLVRIARDAIAEADRAFRQPGIGRAVLRKLGFRPTGQIAQRQYVARGRDVACALFEEGEGDGSDVVTLMRGRIDSDADFREQFR